MLLQVKNLKLKLKDTGNGIFEGEFKSLERGKFQMIWKDKIKYFIINDINNKEVEKLPQLIIKLKATLKKRYIHKNFNIFGMISLL